MKAPRFLLALLFIQTDTSICFLPTRPLGITTRDSSSKLRIGIEPFLPDIAIATVSAAAGAATQLPKIQALERELDTAKASLSESESEMVEKIHVLEDKLHQMDDEFEQQTAKIKRKFDHQLRDEVARVAAKAKQDYEFKLNIEIKEEKLKILSDAASRFNFGAKRQAELNKLRTQQTQWEQTNKELEDALEKSEQELTKLNELASKKKGGWWPFA